MTGLLATGIADAELGKEARTQLLTPQSVGKLIQATGSIQAGGELTHGVKRLRASFRPLLTQPDLV